MLWELHFVHEWTSFSCLEQPGSWSGFLGESKKESWRLFSIFCYSKWKNPTETITQAAQLKCQRWIQETKIKHHCIQLKLYHHPLVLCFTPQLIYTSFISNLFWKIFFPFCGFLSCHPCQKMVVGHDSNWVVHIKIANMEKKSGVMSPMCTEFMGTVVIPWL